MTPRSKQATIRAATWVEGIVIVVVWFFLTMILVRGFEATFYPDPGPLPYAGNYDETVYAYATEQQFLEFLVAVHGPSGLSPEELQRQLRIYHHERHRKRMPEGVLTLTMLAGGVISGIFCAAIVRWYGTTFKKDDRTVV